MCIRDRVSTQSTWGHLHIFRRRRQQIPAKMEDKIKYFLSLLLQAGCGGLVLISIIMLALYIYQNNLLYIPVISPLGKESETNPEGYRSPADRNLPYEDVTIRSADGIKLRGWFIKQKNTAEAATVVFFHENAGNIGTRLAFLENYYWALRVNLLIVAYRGYSKSDGVPSERGLQLDAQAIMEYIYHRDDIDRGNIFVHGRSLGGAVGVYILHNNEFNVRGFILENSFTSIPDMVDVIFPKLSVLKAIVLRNYWPSLERIKSLRIPTLFIMSLKDEIVPSAQMDKLYESAVRIPIKEKYEIPEGTHNTNWTINPHAYFESIRRFMQNVKQFIQLLC
eukprot:TRINITY_DN6126_c0_g2_i3.p1 TRINITY_DN6126_c0_g2~~TRINITY_DN6126_c0_g2_i3.p1  ORF type:complete len:367 (-),score=104.22 TRINITY_DN6126_c0_g2_i3:176-1183(-)